jgi:hypothetical protein
MKFFQPLGSPLRWPCLLGRHFTDFFDRFHVRYPIFDMQALPVKDSSSFPRSNAPCPDRCELYRSYLDCYQWRDHDRPRGVYQQQCCNTLSILISFLFIYFYFSQILFFAASVAGHAGTGGLLKRSPCPPHPLERVSRVRTRSVGEFCDKLS